jgi:protein gp37
MANSKIEWTQATWNPTTGCTKISLGCANCYAERMSGRLNAMGVEKYKNGFSLTIHQDTLEKPIRWKKPKLIFVDSMSDLFHENVPFDYIQKVFNVMKQAAWHQFQILTKRSKRMLDISNYLDWPSNVWMGVSVESQEYSYRIDRLNETRAAIKFLSLEPLLGPMPNIPLVGIDWVIVGGESGPGARPMKEEWVTSIRDMCISTNTPFFFKQWGGKNKKISGRSLQGITWSQIPV